MDSVKCEALLIAAEQGSLTRAGEILGYTQSGITRMIRSARAQATREGHRPALRA